MLVKDGNLTVDIIIDDKKFNKQLAKILNNSQKLMQKMSNNLVNVFKKDFGKINRIAKTHLKFNEVNEFVKSCQNLEKSLSRSERIVSSLFPKMSQGMNVQMINTGNLADSTVKKMKKAFAKVDTINRLSFGTDESVKPNEDSGKNNNPSIDFTQSIQQAEIFSSSLDAINQKILSLPTEINISASANMDDIYNKLGDINLTASLNIDNISAAFEQALSLVPTFSTNFSQSIENNLNFNTDMFKSKIVASLDISVNVGDITASMQNNIDNALNNIDNSASMNVGQVVTTGIVDGIKANIVSVLSAGETILATLIGPFTSGKDVLIEKLSAILDPIQGFIDDFSTAFSAIDTLKEPFIQIRTVVDDVKTAFDTLTGAKKGQELAGELSAANEGIKASGFIETIQNLGANCLTQLTNIISGLFSPISLIVLAIAALAAGFLYLYSTSDSFRELINGMFDSIVANVQIAIASIIAIIQTIWEVGFQPMVESVMLGFQFLWENGLALFIENVSVFVLQIIELILSIWNNAIAPFIDLLLNILLPIFTTVWDGLLAIVIPIVEKILEYINGFMEVINIVIGLLQEHFFPIFKTIFEGLSERVQLFWEFISPIFDWFMDLLAKVVTFLLDYFLSPIDRIFQVVVQVIKDIAEPIANTFDGIKQLFQGILDFVTGIFTGDWGRAWDGVKNIFVGMWNTLSGVVGTVWSAICSLFTKGGDIFKGISDGISNAFKDVVNCIINGINSVIKWPMDKINGLLNSIREFNIPIIGKPFLGLWGPNPLPVPQIPLLAQGGYVKANQPQLAMIGDNRHQGEIVAPEDKMLEMINIALSKQKEQQSLVGIEVLISLIKDLIVVVKNVNLKVDIDSKKLSILLDNAKKERQMIGG